MADRNGVCKRNVLFKRVHQMKFSTDVFGHKFEVCDRCGAVFFGGILKAEVETVQRERGYNKSRATSA